MEQNTDKIQVKGQAHIEQTMKGGKERREVSRNIEERGRKKNDKWNSKGRKGR